MHALTWEDDAGSAGNTRSDLEAHEGSDLGIGYVDGRQEDKGENQHGGDSQQFLTADQNLL